MEITELDLTKACKLLKDKKILSEDIIKFIEEASFEKLANEQICTYSGDFRQFNDTLSMRRFETSCGYRDIIDSNGPSIFKERCPYCGKKIKLMW